MLEAIVNRLPPPKGDASAPLKALLVDSWYDAYLGVVVLVRVVDGTLKKGQRIRMMGTDATYEVDRVGVFTPKRVELGELGPGEIGFLTASIKEVADTRVGDTITDDRSRWPNRCPAFAPPSRWCSAACSRSTPRISGLSRNRLSSLPVTLGRLVKLERLHAGYNQLESLPDSIGALAALTRIDLFENQLRALPATIRLDEPGRAGRHPQPARRAAGRR